MDRNFWKGKKILVTGFEGFVGSNLTKKLISFGARVTGLDIKVKREDTLLTKDDYMKLTIFKGSVASYKLVREILSSKKIEFIFHLAAETIVGRCLKSPKRTFFSNICGTWNILEACRASPRVKAIVVASSDKAYGIKTKLPYKENSSLGGCYPYDVSKSCADLVSSAYFHTYGLPVCITRCGNIFGPGDFNFSRIIPDNIKAVIKNRTLLLRSNGKFTRDYIYIEDIILGYLSLAQNLQKLKLSGEAFNFSNDKPVSVLELVKIIYKLAGKKPNYRILNQAKYEIRDQYLSSQKARVKLGWHPKYTLYDGLKVTIEWYKDYFERK